MGSFTLLHVTPKKKGEVCNMTIWNTHISYICTRVYLIYRSILSIYVSIYLSIDLSIYLSTHLSSTYRSSNSTWRSGSGPDRLRYQQHLDCHQATLSGAWTRWGIFQDGAGNESLPGEVVPTGRKGRQPPGTRSKRDCAGALGTLPCKSFALKRASTHVIRRQDANLTARQHQ